MKSATFLLSSTICAAFGGILGKRQIHLSILLLLIVATHRATAAPAKLDSLDSTFPIDLQPPIFEAAVASSTPTQPHGVSGGTTIDSYGNPIASLQPIETPDGRKVVSAQGLQFEIPNYASGITELKKPADDLLPPFIGEFSNDFDITASTTASTDEFGQRNDDRPGIRINNKDPAEADHGTDANSSAKHTALLRHKRQLQITIDTNIKNNNNNNNYNLPPQNINTNAHHLNIANTTIKNAPTTSHKRLDDKLTFTNTDTASSNLINSLSFFVSEQSRDSNSFTFNSSPAVSLYHYEKSFHSPSSTTKLSDHFIPLSNGNFRYPNVPTDAQVIDHILSKYKNPLPNLDPIIVAQPNESVESFSTSPSPSPNPATSQEMTSVDVESVPLVEVKTQPAITHGLIASLVKGLPDYILELNDPDIGGPVDYQPSESKGHLNIIAWDLVPPYSPEDTDDKTIGHSSKGSTTAGPKLVTQASHETSHTAQRSQISPSRSTQTEATPTYTKHTTANIHASTITPPTTPKATTTTTTPAPRTTTTTRTTANYRTTLITTRRATTPRPTTTIATTTEPDSSEFFKLEAGDSYTLPTWLQDVDDPELDVAVAYIVPEDINEYNHTLDNNLLPPLEPYTDLNNLQVTPPPLHKISTTATRTTTTRRPTTTTTAIATARRPNPSTSQPHWIRAKPTSSKPTIATFNNQFTSLRPFISSTNFAQRTTSTTTTTTVKPKSSLNFHNRQFSSNIPQTDKIGDSGEEVKENRRNPVLSSFNDGGRKPQSITRRTTTTTTTTTTTPAPEIIQRNPFQPTIPPWLNGFDYPDLGPGVPFVYDPNEDENPVNKNILPPSKTEDSDKTNTLSTAPFFNSQTPQGFTNKLITSSIPSTSSTSIPSTVTIPLPSTQTNPDSRFTRPPIVFVPPQPTTLEGIVIPEKSDDLSKQTSSTFNNNFAAPFDIVSGSSTATTANGGNHNKIPLSAERESFPPFNNFIAGTHSASNKTTFSKSEEGKVITNNIFLNGNVGSASAPVSATVKPAGPSQAVNNQEKVPATPNTYGSSSISYGTKYTGRFGGPPGILSPEGNPAATATTRSSNKPAFTASSVTQAPDHRRNTKERYTGSFGGPPGVLKPYDN